MAGTPSKTTATSANLPPQGPAAGFSSGLSSDLARPRNTFVSGSSDVVDPKLVCRECKQVFANIYAKAGHCNAHRVKLAPQGNHHILTRADKRPRNRKVRATISPLPPHPPPPSHISRCYHSTPHTWASASNFASAINCINVGHSNYVQHAITRPKEEVFLVPEVGCRCPHTRGASVSNSPGFADLRNPVPWTTSTNVTNSNNPSYALHSPSEATGSRVMREISQGHPRSKPPVVAASARRGQCGVIGVQLVRQPSCVGGNINERLSVRPRSLLALRPGHDHGMVTMSQHAGLLGSDNCQGFKTWLMIGVKNNWLSIENEGANNIVSNLNVMITREITVDRGGGISSSSETTITDPEIKAAAWQDDDGVNLGLVFGFP